MRAVGAAALLHGAVHLDVVHGERLGVKTLDLSCVKGEKDAREDGREERVSTRRRQTGKLFLRREGVFRVPFAVSKNGKRVENPGVVGGDPDGERRAAPPRRADAGGGRVVHLLRTFQVCLAHHSQAGIRGGGRWSRRRPAVPAP